MQVVLNDVQLQSFNDSGDDDDDEEDASGSGVSCLKDEKKMRVIQCGWNPEYLIIQLEKKK